MAVDQGRIVDACELALMGSKSMLVPCSRSEARAAGLNKYFTGRPCRNGHIAERYAANTICVQCCRIHNRRPGAAERREAYRKRPERKRRSHRYIVTRKYNLVEGAWDKMMEAQDECCAICKSDISKLPTSHVHVDHDHKTRRVRALLCRACNLAVGAVKENPEIADRLAAYIRLQDDWSYCMGGASRWQK